MQIVTCYVNETDNAVLGYLLENGCYIAVGNITEEIINLVDNMYYNRKIGHFVRKHTSTSIINKVSVGLNMSKQLYMQLPAELVQYVGNLAKYYKHVETLAETIETIGDTEYNLQNTNGWNMINVCRKLRQAVANKTLRIDESMHTSNRGNNVQLFEFIKQCDYTVEEFVYNYFRCVQPFMLEIAPKHMQVKGMTCICDVFYRFLILIKYQKSKDGTGLYVVSFHESNIKGSMHTVNNILEKRANVAVLTDYKYPMLTKYMTDYKFSFCRGFARWQIETKGTLLQEDLIVIDTNVILEEIQQSITASIYNIFNLCGIENSEIDIMLTRITPNVKNYTITAYGGNTLNNLSLLMELATHVKNDAGLYRAVCELFLITYTFLLSETEWDSVLEMLKKRYFLQTVTGNNAMLQMLQIIGKRIEGAKNNE